MERLSLKQKERWCRIFFGVFLIITGLSIIASYLIYDIYHFLKYENARSYRSYYYTSQLINLIRPLLFVKLGFSVISESETERKGVQLTRSAVYSCILFFEYMRTICAFFYYGRGLMRMAETLICLGFVLHCFRFKLTCRDWAMYIFSGAAMIFFNTSVIFEMIHPINMVSETVFSLYRIPLFASVVLVGFELYYRDEIRRSRREKIRTIF